MIVKLAHPQIRAFNAFTHNQIPGVTEVDFATLTVTMALNTPPGGVARSSRRKLNFYLRVDNDAPDDVKRLYPRFVDPSFAPEG